jgi:FkbM family methyltransferase
MLTLAKLLLKRLFPRLFLRLRVRKLLAGRVDLDLHFLAHLKKYLLDSSETSHFASYLSSRHSAIDVGACGGEYSCVMASYFERVLSVEPTSAMASKLRLALPDNCEVIECALGRVCEEVNLKIPKIADDSMHALATVANHDFDCSNIGTVDIVKVRQMTIDKLASERSLTPSLIKIDVEGYEGEVLLGSRETIQKYRPILMIEIEKRHNRNFLEIFRLLSSYEYVAFHFHGEKLQASGPHVVDESYDYLKSEKVSGMAEVIAFRAASKYINNFLFLPNDVKTRPV